MRRFVLGSGSKSRLKLIEQSGFVPDLIEAPDVDETPLKKEKVLDYVKRVSKAKCEFLSKRYSDDVVLTADTVMSHRGQIVRKIYTGDDIKDFLESCSGRSVKAITSLCVYDAEKISQKTIETSLKYKHLNKSEIDEYVKSGIGIGKAGGVAIESFMECFVIRIIGSYSNILGLPLYDVNNMLVSAGIKRKIQNSPL
ncbi:MAG: Maf family nucleotide pyrophosphatase [Rickettsiales bacterium]|jgi:septum formation protein|nr:Maf family nucleotide pyrophosphatase [Rickettsiales bacterium]